jgi:ribosomal protein S27AE
MTDKQLKHKLKELKSVKKQKVSRKNRNGKVGITTGTMLASYAPRKECYNCGSTKHLASFCTKNKNINSLPSKSEVKNDYVKTRPQTLCKHCGSTWHSIYTCRDYHAIYHNYYELKPNLKWVRVNSANVNSDKVSLNSDDKNSAAKADKVKKAKGSKQVWILKSNLQ